MKRNDGTVKAGRLKKTHGKKSRYAAKVAAGRQMYGPGCCAHTVTDESVAKARRAAYAEGRLSRTDWSALDAGEHAHE